MIDWTNVLYNALWILALAIALAAVSWASWQASLKNTRLRVELSMPGMQTVLNVSGFLFTLGLALTAERGFERSLWFLGGTYFLVQTIVSIYGPRLKDV